VHVAGKLPATTGWQPVLPSNGNSRLHFLVIPSCRREDRVP
jgi:hypothetical protein